MQYKLVVVAGDSKEKELLIEPPVVLGRSRNADIRLGHPLVSRRHCEITQGEDGTLIVEDLGSLNGTFHGKHRIEEAVYLEPGDLLTVGALTFKAVYDAPQEEGEGEMFEFAGAESDVGLIEEADELETAAPAAKETLEDVEEFLDDDEVEEVEEVVEVEPEEPGPKSQEQQEGQEQQADEDQFVPVASDNGDGHQDIEDEIEEVLADEPEDSEEEFAVAAEEDEGSASGKKDDDLDDFLRQL